jgi:hypothetical protein
MVRLLQKITIHTLEAQPVGEGSWHWTGPAATLAMALAMAPVKHQSISLSVRSERDHFDETGRLYLGPK